MRKQYIFLLLFLKKKKKFFFNILGSFSILLGPRLLVNILYWSIFRWSGQYTWVGQFVLGISVHWLFTPGKTSGMKHQLTCGSVVKVNFNLTSRIFNKSEIHRLYSIVIYFSGQRRDHSYREIQRLYIDLHERVVDQVANQNVQ